MTESRDSDLLRTFLRTHELTFCGDMGAVMVFDAPADFCGVVVDLGAAGPSAWVQALVDRGWCAIHGALHDVVWRLSELYELETHGIRPN